MTVGGCQFGKRFQGYAVDLSYCARWHFIKHNDFVGRFVADALFGECDEFGDGWGGLVGADVSSYVFAVDEVVDANGTGFSYGGRLKHSIGNSNLFWVTSARGSYLSGDERIGIPFNVEFAAGGLGGGTNEVHDAKLVIAEFQTGIEWDYALTAIPANAFVRVSYEFQNWNVNGPQLSTLGSVTSGGVTTGATGSTGLGELTLQGIALAGGITW